jgi:hypothetical protein
LFELQLFMQLLQASATISIHICISNIRRAFLVKR